MSDAEREEVDQFMARLAQIKAQADQQRAALAELAGALGHFRSKLMDEHFSADAAERMVADYFGTYLANALTGAAIPDD